jgi:hypothetical protein
VAEFELKNVAAVRSYIQAKAVPCVWRDVTGCSTFWTDDAMRKAEREVEHLREVAPEIACHVSVVKTRKC